MRIFPFILDKQIKNSLYDDCFSFRLNGHLNLNVHVSFNSPIFTCCRLYTVEEFSVQTCSKCLLWMPDELFNTELVQNQSLSVKRHLITFRTQHSDIKNPLSSKVNAIFSYQKICEDAFYVVALQRTEGRRSEI